MTNDRKNYLPDLVQEFHNKNREVTRSMSTEETVFFLTSQITALEAGKNVFERRLEYFKNNMVANEFGA